MENYPSYSYPESGDSSPRSREIDFENPPPSWEDHHLPLNHKVKFMVSYGGKIQPRSHDNLLSYVGGETKILSVDRNIKFPSLLSKLSSLVSPSDEPLSFTFKYQLPGEDLDALISVTNDDDLEHMMHEYDRLFRLSSKPARLRLFLFPLPHSSASFGSGSSEPGKVDFLFGLDKGPPVQVQRHEPEPPQIDARIQELNRVQISSAQEFIRPKTEDNFVGDAYQKPHPGNIPTSVQIPPGYWQPPPPAVEHHQQPPPPQPPQQQFNHHPQQQQQQQHQQQPPPPQQQQPVYMMQAPPAPASVYHAPVVRPVSGQPNPGYYPVQREQPVYNMPPAPTVPTPTQTPGKMGGYSEGTGLPVRPVAGLAADNTGYAQVAYDSATGRQVYYAAPGGPPGVGVVTAPFQAMAVSGGEMRSAEGKVVQKVVPTSTAV